MAIDFAHFDSPDPAGGMQTIAQRDGDEWVITGEKHYTTNGTGWERKDAICTPSSAAPIPRQAPTRPWPLLPCRGIDMASASMIQGAGEAGY